MRTIFKQEQFSHKYQIDIPENCESWVDQTTFKKVSALKGKIIPQFPDTPVHSALVDQTDRAMHRMG